MTYIWASLMIAKNQSGSLNTNLNGKGIILQQKNLTIFNVVEGVEIE